jgi:diguanylate cyclase (GGDEF)-like protein
MTIPTMEQLAAADTSRAVEIADRIWWVGHHLPGDSFQCHVYLIEHGDQCVLIDPGSRLTFESTLAKVEQVTSFHNIRYFICHHQDPDITASLSDIDAKVERDDASIVCHWRGQALIKHVGVRLPFFLIDQRGWRLDLDGRELEFVFTPYMHFPGAFCTFDRRTGVLFSSDIFGGFTDSWSLVARDESHFETIRSFHEHYMPSREVLNHGLSQLEALDLELIAPQHGSLIPKPLIAYMIERLKGLDCGLFLASREMADVQRLSHINQMLRRVLDAMVLYRDFREVALALLELIQSMVPARSLEFCARWQDDGEILHFGPQTRFRGERIEAPPICAELFGLDRSKWEGDNGSPFVQRELPTSSGTMPSLILPLHRPNTDEISGLAIVPLARAIEVTPETIKTLDQIRVPLEVAVERERIYRVLEMERQEIYERAIRDPLTGLYTRTYLQETVRRMLEQHDRDPAAGIALIMLDIDHFKRINDTYGHLVGDEVLKQVAGVIRAQLRGFDLAVRLGGEEFGVFLTGRSANFAAAVAERTRDEVARLLLPKLEGDTVTVSAGVAVRRVAETLEELIARADSALYEAKRGGRNRVITSDYPAVQLTL